MDNTVTLACKSLERSYGPAFTLGPIDLTIGHGVTCLVGANGAGKSTLFRLVAGLEQPTAGNVEVSGRAGASALGYLPQDPTFPPRAACSLFLDHVAWLQRVHGDRRADAVAKALEAVGLTERADQRISTLSGGMLRRLGIAHALVHDPGVLLLDEPTVGLDPRQRVRLRETIAAISQQRIVVVSTHLVEDVRGLADRVVVLDRGEVVHDGDVGSLEQLSDPDQVGDTPLEKAITGLIGAAE